MKFPKLSEQQKLFGFMLLIVAGLWFLLHKTGTAAPGDTVGASDTVGGSAGVPLTPAPPMSPCNVNTIVPAAHAI